jgi:hypothetical protein
MGKSCGSKCFFQIRRYFRVISICTDVALYRVIQSSGSVCNETDGEIMWIKVFFPDSSLFSCTDVAFVITVAIFFTNLNIIFKFRQLISLFEKRKKINSALL